MKDIPIDSHLIKFKQYLDANNRCIFSSRFGNGKSYFISNFIEKYSDDYLFITIYPVNYQVMDNKDIFELIKRDILIKLLSNESAKIENIKTETSFCYYEFFKNNKTDIKSYIIDVIPSINIFGIDINISNVIKKIDDLKHKYELWKKEVTKSKIGQATIYTKIFENNSGSIYEFDATSQLIYAIIKEYKNNFPKKKVILIIEDLDRIDPAHIFRILNVFSAHFDRFNAQSLQNDTSEQNNISEQNNKFGFDKIISVCDIDNIRNIYSHIYGENTDFLGYISKFSNSQPYKYSLQDLIKEYISTNLLDKELLEYPNIYNYISEMIVSKMTSSEQVEANLRIIKERIIHSKDSIINKQIPLVKQLEGRYITTKSTFTYFLSLLNSFNIKFETLKKTLPKEELISIVGKNWYLIEQFTNDIHFILNGDSLNISYTIDRRGSYYKEFVTDPYFSMKLESDKKELLECKIHYSENSNNILTNMMYDYIDKIVIFLNKNVLI